MNSLVSARYLLKKWIDEFDPKEVDNNQQYLEYQLKRLENQREMYRHMSTNRDLSPHRRARCRDLEQATSGLINGIKFGISFFLYAEKDFAEIDGIKEVIEGAKN